MELNRKLAIVLCAAFAVLTGYFIAWQSAAAAVLAALAAFGTGLIGMRREPARDRSSAVPQTLPAAPDAISIAALENAAVLIDGDFAVLATNAGAQEIFGRIPQREDLRVAVRHPAVIEGAALAIQQRREVVREIEGLGRQSAVFHLRAAPADAGRWLLSFADVTSARLAERMRADFVANASHELRTPLATLIGFLETLQGSASGDRKARARFLAVMAEEAARMARLVDDLLSLSRIELDKNVRPRELVALAPLLEHVGKAAAVALDGDRRALELRIADDLPAVLADRDQILQVLHNLVSNAIKYGRTGTPIRLAAEAGESPRGEVVRITVGDIGDGIAAEHIPRLTERFYRVDTARSRRLGGTGLGLAIVKHIIERHRGTLEISSVAGEGTTVGITLPAPVSQNRNQVPAQGADT